VRALAPALATAAAPEEIRTAVVRARFGLAPRRPAYRLFAVPERWELRRIVSPRFVRAAHRAGLAVYVWTVDEEADIHRLLAWGVDGLITDRPDVAVRVVRGVGAAAAARP
jgi:glycerophosphoryl diester phosphodiesterase